jgi:hypothetical protein
MVKTIPRPEWATELSGFTDRNAGRHTSLRVEMPEMGTQIHQWDYQLRGVVYDRKDDRIEIMIGGFEGVGPHLTHSIGGVEAVDLITDSTGRDEGLRIAQREGETILRIESLPDARRVLEDSPA